MIKLLILEEMCVWLRLIYFAIVYFRSNISSYVKKIFSYYKINSENPALMTFTHKTC